MELVANRGAGWHFPVNSMAAFRRALQDGASVLQMEVYRTKDGQIIISNNASWHNKSIMRTRYEVLSSQLLSLEEVLNAFPNIQLNLTIAARDLRTVYLTVNLIRKYKAEKRVCLTSFYLEVSRWLEDLNYEGEKGLSFLELLFIGIMPIAVLRGFDWKNRRAQMAWNRLFVYMIRRCQQLEIPVDCQGVNQLSIAKQLMVLGVERIVTDDPATLVSLCFA